MNAPPSSLFFTLCGHVSGATRLLESVDYFLQPALDFLAAGFFAADFFLATGFFFATFFLAAGIFCLLVTYSTQQPIPLPHNVAHFTKMRNMLCDQKSPGDFAVSVFTGVRRPRGRVGRGSGLSGRRWVYWDDGRIMRVVHPAKRRISSASFANARDRRPAPDAGRPIIPSALELYPGRHFSRWSCRFEYLPLSSVVGPGLNAGQRRGSIRENREDLFDCVCTGHDRQQPAYAFGERGQDRSHQRHGGRAA